MPTSQEFLDIVLSRTQRQLPTVIRAGFKISRIRGIVAIPRLKALFACDGREAWKWLLGMVTDKKIFFFRRIGFYTRKVKYTQETFCEKFQAILDGFPRLQDIHPFRKFAGIYRP